MYVGSWAGVTYLRYAVLMSPKKGETAVHCCDPAFSVLVMLVFGNAFYVVSVLQSIVCLNIFWQISCRYYVVSVYRVRSLVVSGFSFAKWAAQPHPTFLGLSSPEGA